MVEAYNRTHTHGINLRDTLLYSGLGIGATVVAAPYVLPMLGIGGGRVDQMLNICSQGAGEFGKGIAGEINKGFAQFGDAGQFLASGGWGSAIASGVIGLGGVMLGNYIEKHFDKEGQIPWGKIIKYASITTSILIALPSILSGISMGITFLSLVLGGGTAGSAVGAAMSGSLGYMGGMQAATATAGVAGLLPHFFTCVLGALPVFGTLAMNQKISHDRPGNTINQTDSLGRIQDMTNRLTVS